MPTAVETLIKTLDLEKIEQNIYRGESPDVGWQRVFGGQVIGQALAAAQRTVDEGRIVHSLQGYFMRPGDPTVPILYTIDRIRDGKSFTTRRVVAVQHGKAIFSLSLVIVAVIMAAPAATGVSHLGRRRPEIRLISIIRPAPARPATNVAMSSRNMCVFLSTVCPGGRWQLA